MESGPVTGEIENTKTGETSALDHYLFCHEYGLKTIIKVTGVGNWTYEDGSMQISADCLGLDGYGFVFEINLTFFPETENKMTRILEDLKADAIFIVSGSYGITPEEELKKVFLSNGKSFQGLGNESEMNTKIV